MCSWAYSHLKKHRAQWVWTCSEDRDDFIITSSCSARGLIKNMCSTLLAHCKLMECWTPVFFLCWRMSVCAQVGFILLFWIFLSLSGFWLHLSFIWLVSAGSSGFGQTGSRPAELDRIIHCAWTLELVWTCLLRPIISDEKHNRNNILFILLHNCTI